MINWHFLSKDDFTIPFSLLLTCPCHSTYRHNCLLFLGKTRRRKRKFLDNRYQEEIGNQSIGGKSFAILWQSYKELYYLNLPSRYLAFFFILNQDHKWIIFFYQNVFFMIMYFSLGIIMLRLEEHHSDRAPHGMKIAFSSKLK